MHDRASRQLDGAGGYPSRSHPIWISSTGGPSRESPTWPSLPRCGWPAWPYPCHTRPPSKTRQAVAVHCRVP